MKYIIILQLFFAVGISKAQAQVQTNDTLTLYKIVFNSLSKESSGYQVYNFSKKDAFQKFDFKYPSTFDTLRHIAWQNKNWRTFLAGVDTSISGTELHHHGELAMVTIHIKANCYL